MLYQGVELGTKVNEIVVHNRRAGEPNVSLLPEDAMAAIYGTKWASHMGWGESRGSIPEFCQSDRDRKNQFQCFYRYASNRARLSAEWRHVLFRIYDADDIHGTTVLVKALLQSGGL